MEFIAWHSRAHVSSAVSVRWLLFAFYHFKNVHSNLRAMPLFGWVGIRPRRRRKYFRTNSTTKMDDVSKFYNLHVLSERISPVNAALLWSKHSDGIRLELIIMMNKWIGPHEGVSNHDAWLHNTYYVFNPIIHRKYCVSISFAYHLETRWQIPTKWCIRWKIEFKL